MEEMIRSLVAVLKACKVAYVVIGGIAASIWGRPRMTLDADIVLVINKADITNLVEKFYQHGFLITSGSRPKMIARLKRLLPVKVRFSKRLSCDIRIASYSIDHEAIKRKKRIKLFNTSLSIATPEDVIVYKLVRFDDLDKADIKTIIHRQGKKIDFNYIKNSISKLSHEINDKQIVQNLREILLWRKKLG